MLKELILKNRSCRGYAQTPRPTEEELKELADCARLCPSASNRQPLRCRLVNDQAECAALQAATRWGGALRELHLPYPGTEATAFLVLCYDSASAKDSPMLRIDTGIAAKLEEVTNATCMPGAAPRKNFHGFNPCANSKLPYTTTIWIAQATYRAITKLPSGSSLEKP